MVKIRIKSCKDPDGCSICLRSCPVGALMKVPIGDMKSKKKKPKYKIRSYFRDLCTGCGLCEKKCPEGVIRVY